MKLQQSKNNSFRTKKLIIIIINTVVFVIKVIVGDKWILNQWNKVWGQTEIW